VIQPENKVFSGLENTKKARLNSFDHQQTICKIVGYFKGIVSRDFGALFFEYVFEGQ
jgi:hypothetical protein